MLSCMLTGNYIIRIPRYNIPIQRINQLQAPFLEIPLNKNSYTIRPPSNNHSTLIHEREIGLEAYFSFLHVDSTAHDFEGPSAAVVQEGVVPEDVHVRSVGPTGQTGFDRVHYPV
jgi:hypothetical protein